MNWLDRTLIQGPYLILCLTKETYKKALKHLSVEDAPPFYEGTENARCLYLETPSGKKATVVTLHDWQGKNPVMVSAMLVHESVHVFQEHCRNMGESRPSEEFEAYSIQSIYTTLACEFVRQTGGEDLVQNREPKPE